MKEDVIAAENIIERNKKIANLEPAILLQTLQEAIAPIKIIENHKRDISVSKVIYIAIFVLSGIFILFASLTMYISNMIFGGISNTGLILLFISVLLFLIGVLYKKKTAKKNNEYNLNIATIFRNSGISVIPENYCQSVALKAMIKYIINGRANNWRDCVNLWEERHHRGNIE